MVSTLLLVLVLLLLLVWYARELEDERREGKARRPPLVLLSPIAAV
jgi:hypothetical protein